MKSRLWLSLCLIPVVLRWALVPYGVLPQRDSIHGDTVTGRWVMNAAHYFRDFGFFRTSGLPVFDYQGRPKDESLPAYAHGMALPNWLAGAMARLTGSLDERVLRLPILLFSIAFLLFLIRWLPSQFTDPLAGTLSLAVVLFSNYFIGWADCLSEQGYAEYFKWLCFAALLASYREPAKTRYLALAGSIALLAALTTPYPVVALMVLSVGLSWAHRQSLLSRQVMVPLAFLVIGVCLHIAMGIHHAGGIAPWWSDILDALHRRTTGAGHTELTLSLRSLWRWPMEWINRPERYFPVSFASLLIFTWLAFREWRMDERRRRIAFVLIGVTFTWALIFPQHFLVHHFMARDIGLWMGWVAGTGMSVVWRQYLRSPSKGRRLFARALFLYTLAIGVVQLLPLFKLSS